MPEQKDYSLKNLVSITLPEDALTPNPIARKMTRRTRAAATTAQYFLLPMSLLQKGNKISVLNGEFHKNAI